MLATAGLAAVAVVLCACAHFEQRFPGDLRVTVLLQSAQSRTLDSVMEWVSYLNGGWRAPVLVIATSILAWRFLSRREAILVLMTWLSAPISSVLKLIVGRPRPSPDLVDVFQAEAGNSFPSGHAFFAIMFWGLLAYFAHTGMQRKGLRILTLSGLAVIIVWVGVSRVYLGAHWTSDVIGGYICGTLFLASLVWLDRRLIPQPRPRDPADTARSDCSARSPDEPIE